MASYRSHSATNAKAISASASAIRTDNVVVRGLWVGVGGDITVSFDGNATTVEFVGVPSGSILPIQVTHMTAVSGGAASILALE